MGTAVHHYHAFGLRIASTHALPELHHGRGPADVEIDFQTVAEAFPSKPESWLTVSGTVARMDLGGHRFTVRDGQQIDVEAVASASGADIRIWLLGTVMAALLHQRGYLPIHANVVATGDNCAAAFAGDSGAGKSTLAAWFEGRGHRVLADDLCGILTGSAGVPRLFEGIPRVKLWSQSLDLLGRDAAGLEKVATHLDKYHVPIGTTRDEGSLEPLQLERLYVLDRAADGETFAIQRLTGAEAAEAIVANAFRWGLGQRIQQPRSQFDQSLAVARHAAIFRVARRWGLDRFTQDAVEIERHLAAPLGEVASKAAALDCDAPPAG